MEFGIEKCAIRIMKWRKRQSVEGIELSKNYQKSSRSLLETENYKFSWILEVDSIKQVEMKEK